MSEKSKQLRMDERSQLVDRLNKVTWEKYPTPMLRAVDILVSERAKLIEREKEMDGEK